MCWTPWDFHVISVADNGSSNYEIDKAMTGYLVAAAPLGTNGSAVFRVDIHMKSGTSSHQALQWAGKKAIFRSQYFDMAINITGVAEVYETTLPYVLTW